MTDYSYNPDTGEITGQRGFVLKNKNARGYIKIVYEGKTTSAHRLAWFLTHGYWPKCIDHINGIKDDNRLINLRECTQSQNLMNTVKRSNNTSGHKGIQRNGKGWMVRIKLQGVAHHLGTYKSIDEAVSVMKSARLSLHGEFARLQ